MSSDLPVSIDVQSMSSVTKIDPLKQTKVLTQLVDDTHQLQGASSAVCESIVEVGKILKRVHTTLHGAGRDGGFSPYVKAYCSFTTVTAMKYIKVFETFGGAKASGTLQHFDVSALHKLSHDETPQEAVTEAVKLAKKGVHVSPAKAKQIVESHVPSDYEVVDDELGTIVEEEVTVNTDLRGAEIPDKLIDVFDEEGFDEARAQLSAALKTIRRIGTGATGKHIDVSPFNKAIKEMRDRLTNATPYAICPKCEGGSISKCTACDRSGWMPLYMFTDYEAKN
jgi:hypothetical protein